MKKAEVREQFMPYIDGISEKGLSTEDIGIDGFLYLMEIMAEKKAENAIYEFLAGPFECAAKDVENMELSELIVNVKQLAKENDLGVFMRSLSGLNGKV
jgi:hypothetical protein